MESRNGKKISELETLTSKIKRDTRAKHKLNLSINAIQSELSGQKSMVKLVIGAMLVKGSFQTSDISGFIKAMTGGKITASTSVISQVLYRIRKSELGRVITTVKSGGTSGYIYEIPASMALLGLPDAYRLYLNRMKIEHAFEKMRSAIEGEKNEERKTLRLLITADVTITFPEE